MVIQYGNMRKILVKRQRFEAALGNLFTGGEVEGESGFVRLMRIKRAYFNDEVAPALAKEVQKHAGVEGEDNDFSEEVYDKLYSFFSRYFCADSGSVYFRHLPRTPPVYDRMYAGERDVAMSWRTRGLYYVKSDKVIRSMTVMVQPVHPGEAKINFRFDASRVENKKNNTRGDFVFSFAGCEDDGNGSGFPTVAVKVEYSERGRKTNVDEFISAVEKDGGSVGGDAMLNRAFAIFKRQTEADYFIHKDAGGFLREQFDSWMFQFAFQSQNVFTEKRVNQLLAIRECALLVIDAVGQFEDELRRIWEKPKFARNVHYVVTADKLPSALRKKIAADKAGMKAQIAEWRELEIVDKSFSADALASGGNKKHRFLPLDTRHFPQLKADILAAFPDLDAALDGEFWKSENWQALNTLRKRYAGRVKCIYIDPPFNLGGGDKFDYRTNYKDSSWATMLENRLVLARDFLSDDGAIFVRCDYNGNHIVRFLMDGIFSDENFLNEIVINRTRAQQGVQNTFNQQTESLFCYSLTDKFRPLPLERALPEAQHQWNPLLDFPRANETPRTVCGKEFYPPKNRRWALSQKRISIFEERGNTRINGDVSYTDCRGEEVNGMPELFYNFEFVGNEWLDIRSYSQAASFPTENSEDILARAITASSGSAGELILDFFAGSGTAQAVAQKLGRKWLGVEMGEHFNTVILPRMKKVIAGHRSGINRNGNGNGNGNGSGCDYKGGGFFKYGEFEQYEETLRRSDYADGDAVLWDSDKSALQQYVFFADGKLSRAVEIVKENKMRVNADKICPGADIVETVANLVGKNIKSRNADSVTFTDGKTLSLDTTKMGEDELLEFIEIIRPCLWWGEE